MMSNNNLINRHSVAGRTNCSLSMQSSTRNHHKTHRHSYYNPICYNWLCGLESIINTTALNVTAQTMANKLIILQYSNTPILQLNNTLCEWRPPAASVWPICSVWKKAVHHYVVIHGCTCATHDAICFCGSIYGGFGCVLGVYVCLGVVEFE